MSNTADSGIGMRVATGSAVQSVDRALVVLELLARDGDLGVTEIALELGVHKSTAFRLVSTLEGRDLVEQNAERGRYRLGVGILRLAGATAARLDLVQQSRPECRGLASAVGETVNVTVLDGHDALYLDQVAGPSALQLHNWVGQRIPVHATSNGKVLLSGLTVERFDEVVALPLERFTERTIVDLDQLRAEIAAARARGYATAVDELEVGLTAIAAPILNVDGDVIASVSASGPSFRIPPGRHGDVAAEVVRTAGQISRRLGWPGHSARER